MNFECLGEERTGGCAFRGAKMSLQPIVDVLHLAHGPISCQGQSWDALPTASTGSTLHRIGLTTDLNELDIVLGGEKRLSAALDQVVGAYDPEAVFVYQTCVPATTGDDVTAICKSAAARLHRPIIPVDAPGFVGGKRIGAQVAAGVLLDRVIGTREPEYTTSTDVVLIGDYNVAGEATRIAALLAAAGIRVLASIPGDGRFADIACAHRARAAITHCSQALDGLAAGLQQRYAIPFVETSFLRRRQCLCGFALHRALVGAPRRAVRPFGASGECHRP